MAYTVKKISKMSGVTIKALHFYEKIGLLKPAYYGSNGYRYYEEKELLQLQQILFFKELGFTLKQIQKVLGKSDFDQLAALYSHRQILSQEIERKGKLVETIDKTIQHLKGQKKMKDEDIYGGFISKEQAEEYKVYLKNRLGEDHPTFAEAEKNCKNWKKEDWERTRDQCTANMQKLAALMQKQHSTFSKEVQVLIKAHYQWVKGFWTPNKETFTGLGQNYTGFEWKPYFSQFDEHHPKFAMFVADAMKEFAEQELE